MKLFDQEGSLVKFVSLFADVIIVGFLWFLTSLPVITMGASSTAAYFVIMRRISDREGTILADYFLAFKNNFIKSTVVFLIFVVLFSINLINYLFFEVHGALQNVITALQLLVAFELIIISIHIFPLVARFDMKTVQLIKSAALMANKHLPTSIVHCLLMGFIVYLSFFIPILIFSAYGVYCWVSSYMLMRLYKKYRPEIDNSDDDENDNK